MTLILSACRARLKPLEAHLVHAPRVQSRDPLLLEGLRSRSFKHGEVADASLHRLRTQLEGV